MGRALPSSDAAPVVTEPSPIPQTLVTSCAGASRISAGCVELLCAATQAPAGGEPDAPKEHVLTARLVIANEAVPDIMRSLAAALDEAAPSVERVTRLVS